MIQKFHAISGNLPMRELMFEAIKKVQSYLNQANEIRHDFKINQAYNGTVSGKMFGVLICKNKHNELGFLAAFSGKLGDKNVYDYFVPPVFDILEKDSFFMQEIQIINAVNKEINNLKTNSSFQATLQQVTRQIQNVEDEILNQRRALSAAKNKRKKERVKYQNDLLKLQELDKQSEVEHVRFKKNRQKLEREIETLKIQLATLKEPLETLKNERSNRSNQLQTYIFEQFSFLNSRGETKSLNELFCQNLGIQPPAGAGECAAPKLIQYAYLNELKPLALAEFWWGQSPKSITRKHGELYPCCKEKCEPILQHTLDGIEIEFIV